jgi:hypothetical protein
MKGRVWYSVFLAVLLTAGSVVAADQYAAPQLEQAIEASCMVASGDGSRGSGCIYGYTGRRGLILTAAHVVADGAKRGVQVTVYVGRRLVKLPCRIVGIRTDVDTATLSFETSDWPQDAGPLPRGVPVAPSDWQVPVGHPVYSVGHPGAVRPALLLVARVVKYSQAGALGFRPGPELGRSGSAVFTHDGDGRVVIVGIISVRDTGGMRANTIGYAITPRQFRGDSRRTPGRGTMYPTQCGPMGCPTGPAQLPGLGDYMLPYRGDMDKRIQKIEQQAQEKSPGTLPLPPMAPPVDLGPLDARLAAVEASLKETIDRSNVHTESIAKLNATAEKAVALAEMVAKRDEAFGRDLATIRADAAKAEQAIAIAADAQSKAENVAAGVGQQVDAAKQAITADVAEKLDEENPKGPLGRLRDRIEGRIEDRVAGIKETLSGMIGLPTILGGTGLGVGGIALILAAVALFYRGSKNAAMGEQTTTQWLASKTSNPYDDMAADFLAEKILARVGDVLPSVQRRKAAASTKK